MSVKTVLVLFVSVFIGLFLILPAARAEETGLVDEDRAFWDELLSNGSIEQKNVFYAGYIAYRENLNELSIESFRECIDKNPANDIVKGVAAYYIGKDLVHMGKYSEAITQFDSVRDMDLGRFNYIKFAVYLNTAIAYLRLNNPEKYREYLQKVISSDLEGKYKRIALDMLSK